MGRYFFKVFAIPQSIEVRQFIFHFQLLVLP
jgi:hypothetical protein